jgi:hypothetical protein
MEHLVQMRRLSAWSRCGMEGEESLLRSERRTHGRGVRPPQGVTQGRGKNKGFGASMACISLTHQMQGGPHIAPAVDGQ